MKKLSRILLVVAIIATSLFVTPSVQAEATLLSVTASCRPQGVIIVFDGTEIPHDGPVWGTVNSVPFLWANNTQNAVAVLSYGSVSSIRGTPQVVHFAAGQEYIFGIWSGSYDSGPQVLLESATVVAPSCQNLFLPFILN